MRRWRRACSAGLSAIVAVVAVPVLVMALAFGIRYADAAQSIQASQDAASAQVQLITNTFEAAGLHVGVYKHPSEAYSSTGYSVYGYISGNDYYEAGQRVYMHLDESGEMDSVRYEEQIDLSTSLEENLTQTQADFDTLGKALEASGVRAKTPGLVAKHAIPEGFRRQFLAGDIYIKIRQPSEDVGGCSVSCSFATDELADFDEHTTPTINLSVTPK